MKNGYAYGIRNTEYICISCCPVRQRSPISFVTKGINILPPVNTWERKKRKILLSITSAIYCKFPKNPDPQGFFGVRSDSLRHRPFPLLCVFTLNHVGRQRPRALGLHCDTLPCSSSVGHFFWFDLPTWERFKQLASNLGWQKTPRLFESC